MILIYKFVHCNNLLILLVHSIILIRKTISNLLAVLSLGLVIGGLLHAALHP